MARSPVHDVKSYPTAGSRVVKFSLNAAVSVCGAFCAGIAYTPAPRGRANSEAATMVTTVIVPGNRR